MKLILCTFFLYNCDSYSQLEKKQHLLEEITTLKMIIILKDQILKRQRSIANIENELILFFNRPLRNTNKMSYLIYSSSDCQE